jgi:hypothetical protein
VNVILRLRRTGRTQQLILLCSEAEKRGEISYIVCSDQQEARRIFDVANELESPVAFPITYQEFLSGQYAGKNIQNFYIDNADRFLQSMTDVPIRAVTMERDMGAWN